MLFNAILMLFKTRYRASWQTRLYIVIPCINKGFIIIIITIPSHLTTLKHFVILAAIPDSYISYFSYKFYRNPIELQ